MTSAPLFEEGDEGRVRVDVWRGDMVGGWGQGEVEEPNSESYRLTRRKKTIVRTSCKPREKGQIRMAITRKHTSPNQPITSFHSHTCGKPC